MRDVISSDRRKSIDDVADDIGVSHRTVHSILKDEMKMSKVSARWMPRLLSAEEKEVRVRLPTVFLRRWSQDGMRFLNQIITTDETWVNFYDPETKRESLVWKTSSSAPPKKAPSADSRREVVSYLRKNVHWVLVNSLIGLSLPRKSVVRLTDRPNMTLAVDRGL